MKLGRLTNLSREALTVLGLGALLLSTSCNNNLLTTGGGTTITQSPPGVGTSVNGSGLILSAVLKDTINPQTVLDLVGDGTGAFGNLCIPVSASNSSATSTTVCFCNYSFSSPTAPNQVRVTPVTYHESDLLRCSYSGLPQDVTSMSVSVSITSSGISSNPVTFQFANPASLLDFSNPTNFRQVIRTQCKNIIPIPYLFDGSNMYDPFQSEDPHLSYPLDFYATNLGLAIGAYSQQSSIDAGTDWSCPPVLNPVLYLDKDFNEKHFTPDNNLNFQLYSKAPLNGDKQMYPRTAGIFDRTNFYLARQSSGIFTIPVNALQSPGVVTAEGSANPPLGYGASPIKLSPTSETCPDTVTLPSKFHWVKVWLFRASLVPRNYNTATPQSIACNPGDWKLGTPSAIFNVCPGQSKNKGASNLFNSNFSNSLDDIGTVGNKLADRVFGSGQNLICGQLENQLGARCGVDAGPSCFLNGTTDLGDLWKAWFIGPNQAIACTTANSGSPAVSSYTGGNSAADVFDVFSFTSGFSAAGASCAYTGPAPSPAPSPYLSGQASPNQNQTQMLAVTPSLPIGTPLSLDNSTASGGSRYDFLFVVTPGNSSISLGDMQNISASSPSLPYQPYRFFTYSDCKSSNPDNPGPDPDNPSAPTCLTNNAITVYQLKLQDVGTNGDPPANDPSRSGVFPVCAIQPDG